jgi:hypothetical protein
VSGLLQGCAGDVSGSKGCVRVVLWLCRVVLGLCRAVPWFCQGFDTGWVRFKGLCQGCVVVVPNCVGVVT